MKSITIHDIDDQMSALLKDMATKEGLSLNKTIKKLLAISLGIKQHASKIKKQEFKEFFNSWTEDEASTFRSNTRDLETVDEGEWK